MTYITIAEFLDKYVEESGQESAREHLEVLLRAAWRYGIAKDKFEIFIDADGKYKK